MDDAELKAEVARAEAERDLARQSLARTRELLSQKASSQSELERAEATARSTEAESSCSRSGSTAPQCARPSRVWSAERLVSLGDYVTTSTGLMSCRPSHPSAPSFRCPSGTPTS